MYIVNNMSQRRPHTFCGEHESRGTVTMTALANLIFKPTSLIGQPKKATPVLLQ
jgi:hypothetical protein